MCLSSVVSLNDTAGLSASGKQKFAAELEQTNQGKQMGARFRLSRLEQKIDRMLWEQYPTYFKKYEGIKRKLVDGNGLLSMGSVTFGRT